MEDFYKPPVSRADLVYSPKVKPLTEVFTPMLSTPESRALLAKCLDNYYPR